MREKIRGKPCEYVKYAMEEDIDIVKLITVQRKTIEKPGESVDQFTIYESMNYRGSS